MLRVLHLARKDLEGYLALTKETGLGTQDCLALARLFIDRGDPAVALTWAERGIDLHRKASRESSPGLDFTKLRRELLVQLGRQEEAREDAWADYCRHPSIYTYEELMPFVPEPERKAWHEKAITASEGADLSSRIELLLKTQELDRLADLVRQSPDQALEDLSHYATGPVAETLEATHPDLAARLWLAQGLRIVNAKKSRYYDAALANFASAKRCFERAGLDSEWQRTVNQVRIDHRRKSGFMPGFERVAAGIDPMARPSFLERAKARWNGGPDKSET
jgi:hypothetical protein